MPRLIDADALLDGLVGNEHGYILIPIRDIKRSVKKAPTIEAEPVRHGKWAHKYYQTIWYGSGEPPEWICSECQDRAYNTYDYCPHCGAKMDLEG